MKHLKTFEFFDVSKFDTYWGPFEGLIDKVNEIAESLGEEVEEDGQLGCGSFGCAFKLKSGRVLKLTSDTGEAIASNRIKKRSSKKHMISIYDVRQTNLEYKDNKVFAIILDFVETLDLDDQNTFDWYADSHFYDESVTDEQFIADIKDHINSYPGDSWLWEFWKKLIPQRQSVLKDIDRSGIYYHEAHSRNVGFDKNGTFKIFDPWMSEIGNLKHKFNKKIKV